MESPVCRRPLMARSQATTDAFAPSLFLSDPKDDDIIRHGAGRIPVLRPAPLPGRFWFLTRKPVWRSGSPVRIHNGGALPRSRPAIAPRMLRARVAGAIVCMPQIPGAPRLNRTPAASTVRKPAGDEGCTAFPHRFMNGAVPLKARSFARQRYPCSRLGRCWRQSGCAGLHVCAPQCLQTRFTTHPQRGKNGTAGCRRAWIFSSSRPVPPPSFGGLSAHGSVRRLRRNHTGHQFALVFRPAQSLLRTAGR